MQVVSAEPVICGCGKALVNRAGKMCNGCSYAIKAERMRQRSLKAKADQRQKKLERKQKVIEMPRRAA